MIKTRTQRAVLLAGTVLIASVSLTGCSMLINSLVGGSGSSQPDANTDIFDLKVGDCKMEDVPGEISDTNVVSCAEPHDEEVYFEFELENGDYPGEDAITAAADERCYPEFVTFAGIEYEESTLDFFSFQPTEESWKDGDRVIQCVIWDPAGPVEGSLAGAAR